MNEEAKTEFTAIDARTAIGAAFQKAYGAGRWMAAVWRVEGGRLYIDDCVTYDFPTVDFDEAMVLLQGKLEEKKKKAPVDDLPPPLEPAVVKGQFGPEMVRGPFGPSMEGLVKPPMTPTGPPAQSVEENPCRQERKDYDAPKTD